MKHKVIFFDWFNTLSNSLFWEHWKGTELDREFNTIQNKLFNNNYYIGWMKGTYTSEDVARLIESKSKIKSGVVLNGLKESAEKFTYISDEVPKYLKRLKKHGHKIVLATDNMDAFSRWTVPSLELDTVFDDVLNSCYQRSLKRQKDKENNSLFFKKYLEDNNIKPRESILIDDDINNKNVEEFGIKFFPIKKCYPYKAFDFLLK